MGSPFWESFLPVKVLTHPPAGLLPCLKMALQTTHVPFSGRHDQEGPLLSQDFNHHGLIHDSVLVVVEPFRQDMGGMDQFPVIQPGGGQDLDPEHLHTAVEGI